MKNLNPLPPYMKIFANRVYENKFVCGFLDDNRIANLRSLWCQNRIIEDMLHDIPKGAHVLQIGLTFGDETARVYEKVKKRGKLDIFDVSETQIALAKEKYAKLDIEISNYNAALPWDEKYDAVICYNILRELPLKTRGKVMDNVLNSLTTGGKAVFVDCSEPSWFNPLKIPLFLYNRLYLPFAESLWNEPLENFCPQKDGYRWYHTYYGGGMFQKTTAIRKILSNEDVRKLTKLFKSKV